MSTHWTWLPLLGTLSFNLLVLPNSARAEQCRLTRDCVYGAEVSDRWIQGERSQQNGDFDAAVQYYQQSLAASKVIQLPHLNAARNQHLRDCAVQGSTARLNGATTGQQILAKHGRSAESLQAAHTAVRSKFRSEIDRLNAQRPDLRTSCP